MHNTVVYTINHKRHRRDLSTHSRRSNEALLRSIAAEIAPAYARCKAKAEHNNSALSCYDWAEYEDLKSALMQMIEVMEELYGEDSIPNEFYSMAS